MKSKAYNYKLVSRLEAKKIAPIELPENIGSVSSSKDAFKIAWSLWDLETIEVAEHFNVLFLSRQNKVMGWSNVSTGGIDSTTVDVKHIMKLALLTNATGLIIYHNHPSGSLLTSKADEEITRKIKQACDILGFSLLDHLVLAPNGEYYSFSDSGLM